MARTATVDRQPDMLDKVTPQKKPAPAKKQQVAKVEKMATVPANPPAERSMLEVIVGIAKDPTIPLERMERIMAMQRQLEQDRAEREFNMAMHKAQHEMPRVVKDKRTDKAWYATLENVSRQIDPIARNNGFVISYGTADSPLAKHYRTVATVMHVGGHTRVYHMDLEADMTGAQGKPNKTAVQGVSSSISFARRVLKLLIFDVVPEGQDRDGEVAKTKRIAAQADGDVATERSDDGIERITESQVDTLIDAIEACGGTRKKFCDVFGIDKIADLPADQFDEAMRTCADLKAKKLAKASK